jgi:serine/threonine protein kinase/Tfp pilus assembly protein PilF
MLAAGTSLGPYQILAPLGAGGMGEVYRARDTRLGRDVAIKVLPAEYAADADRLRRFEQEARAASALDHPNILVVHDVGTHGGAPYLVTELLEGATLRDRLAGGALPSGKAIELAVQIASGLAAAHEKGIAHRDLKPENLFVTKDGRVKVLDFGLAKLTRPEMLAPAGEKPTSVAPTETGALLGTVGYMSPEQARGESADSRSDIFSFGCVLFEMLSGQRAFQKKTAVETLHAILKEDPRPLVSSIGPMPPAVERIVRHCLEKRPEDRFASASDLHFALQSLLQAPSFEPAAREPTEKSIVVLPFENLSPDPENAYFADGLTEEIIADLAQVRALRVISRTSAMLLRGSKKDVPTIARELNVRYALEGSVRRAGQTLRITAQLIDAVADTHLWAEKYTGTFEDVFDMQEKVSRAIVEALRLELTPQEHRRLAERPIPNVRAYECYLKARHEIWRCAARSLDRAMEYLEDGLRAMPDNPLLLAGVAYVHFQRVNLAVGQEDSLQRAEAFATRALELAPGLPQAHVVLGLIAAWRPGMVKAAIAHFDQALAADPSDLDGLKWSGVFYAFLGRTAEAAAMGERVIAMDPMSPMSYWSLVFAHWLEGRLPAALDVLKAASKADPGDSILETTRVILLIQMGRRDEALALAEQAERDERLTIVHRMALLWRYALAGDRETALSWMTPEALRTCRQDLQYSWWVACAYVMLGDVDSALDWLGNAIDVGFLNYRYLGEIDPILAPLRGDPRFQALMARARTMQTELEARP